jgi:hypothetical protein
MFSILGYTFVAFLTTQLQIPEIKIRELNSVDGERE